MPTIFIYLGIYLRFHSNDHYPLHFHAYYKESETIIKIYLKNGHITKITYEAGVKPFTPSKLKDLKQLVERYKNEIVSTWTFYFIYNKRIKPRTIHRQDL